MTRPIILGIDASRSTRACPTGVEIYSTAIIEHLLKAVERRRSGPKKGGQKVELRLYTPKWISFFPKKLQRHLPSPRLWTLVRLSWEMLWHKPDVLFVPAHVLPFFAPRKSFVTVHDIAYEKIPEAYGFLKRGYLRWSTKRALQKARKVFAPTESVKSDLVNIYGADTERILVVPHGLTPLPKVTATQIKHFYNKHELSPKELVFFFIGRLERKKNLLMLVEAWSIVQKMYSSARLVLAGMNGHGFEDIQMRIEKEGLKKSIVMPGYISEVEASVLFHTATCFVFPSREEGFGLPILQAFEAGCLVIASDIPPLREVAGEAALFANPGNSKDFAEQIMRIVEDLALRDRLKILSKAQLKRFSWEKAAEAVLKVLLSNPDFP